MRNTQTELVLDLDMKKIKMTFLGLLLCLLAVAQGPSKRYGFAKAYFGADVVYTPSYGSSQFLNSSEQIEEFLRNGFVTPSINIGATHFWGYADIYVSICTRQIKFAQDEVATTSSAGVYTGFRLYPWQLTDKKVRPFIGYKFSPQYYEQESASVTKVKSVLDLGVGYRLPSAYLYIGYNRMLNPLVEIPVSRDVFVGANFPRQSVNFGVNWMIETTYTSQSEKFTYFNELFSNSNKNGLYFGIGPSSAFPVIRSTYIQEDLRFLDDLAMPAIFMDISAGYHFSKQDISVGLAYRPIKQYRSGFDFQQSIRRRSISLEAFKFLGDYHGFAPFLGAGLSFEALHLREADMGILVRDARQESFTPLVVFGWDIRPGIKNDPWLLRTNLRYAPFLNFKVDDLKLSMQHIEFNFIQAVIYPGRIKKWREK